MPLGRPIAVAIPALLRVDWSSSLRVFAVLFFLGFHPPRSNAAVTQTGDYQDAVRLVQQKQFDRAAELLQAILIKTPDDLRARNLLGIALSAADRREEANEQFNKVLAINPGFVPALKNLAVNELALQHSEAAKAHFEQALASAPMFYADIVEAIGSDDGREIACGLDELRQAGRLGRDRDGRYHLASSDRGVTAIVGALYRDPNAGT